MLIPGLSTEHHTGRSHCSHCGRVVSDEAFVKSVHLERRCRVLPAWLTRHYEKLRIKNRMDTELIEIREDIVISNLAKCVAMMRECATAEDAKKFIDLGFAAKVWATRQARGIEARNAAEEFVLRAERRLGEILLESAKHQGGRPADKPVTRKVQVSKLADIGISRNLSSRSQRLAEVPLEKFEAALASSRKAGQEIRRNRIEGELFVTASRPEQPWNATRMIPRIVAMIRRKIANASDEEQVSGLAIIVACVVGDRPAIIKTIGASLQNLIVAEARNGHTARAATTEHD